MNQAVLRRILSAAMLAAVLALSALPGCGAEGAAPTAGSPAQTTPATPTTVAAVTPLGSPAGPTPDAAPAATASATADGHAPTMPPSAVTAPSPDDATAFDFRFTLFQGGDLVGGDSLDLSDLRGAPVVLNFWARLCTPCWAEMPELQDFYEEFGTRVHLLGIDIGKFTGFGSPKDASGLLDSLGITYPAGFTEEGAVVRAYEVRGLPTTVFITAEGKVFRIWTGALDRQAVTEITEAMLKEGTR